MIRSAALPLSWRKGAAFPIGSQKFAATPGEAKPQYSLNTCRKAKGFPQGSGKAAFD